MPLESLMYPRQMSYSVALLYTVTFMGIELNKLTIDVSLPFALYLAKRATCFYKILIHQKGKSIFEAPRNIILICLYSLSLSLLSPSLSQSPS